MSDLLDRALQRLAAKRAEQELTYTPTMTATYSPTTLVTACIRFHESYLHWMDAIADQQREQADPTNNSRRRYKLRKRIEELHRRADVARTKRNELLEQLPSDRQSEVMAGMLSR